MTRMEGMKSGAFLTRAGSSGRALNLSSCSFLISFCPACHPVVEHDARVLNFPVGQTSFCSSYAHSPVRTMRQPPYNSHDSRRPRPDRQMAPRHANDHHHRARDPDKQADRITIVSVLSPALATRSLLLGVPCSFHPPRHDPSGGPQRLFSGKFGTGSSVVTAGKKDCRHATGHGPGWWPVSVAVGSDFRVDAQTRRAIPSCAPSWPVAAGPPTPSRGWSFPFFLAHPTCLSRLSSSSSGVPLRPLLNADRSSRSLSPHSLVCPFTASPPIRHCRL